MTNSATPMIPTPAIPHIVEVVTVTRRRASQSISNVRDSADVALLTPIDPNHF
jgi:hypothetical protein